MKFEKNKKSDKHVEQDEPLPEPEFDEWWAQLQTTNACAEQRPKFGPISDIWRFRPRFERFTRDLQYRGPFLKFSSHQKIDPTEQLWQQLLEQDGGNEQQEQEQEQVEEGEGERYELEKEEEEEGQDIEGDERPQSAPPLETEASLTTDCLSENEVFSSDEDEDNARISTDLEQEVDQVKSGIYAKSNREAILQAQIRKYVGEDAVISDKETNTLLRSYIIACNKLKVPVLHAVAKAIAHSTTIIDLRHYSISCDSMQPLIQVLEKCKKITTLVLEDCGLGMSRQGGHTVASIIEKNKNLQNLNISSNFFGPRAVSVITRALEKNQTLEYVNVSRNQFVDSDCAKIVEALSTLNFVNAFDISGNEIGHEAAIALTDWLLQPDCKLKILNIGWSGIRRKVASIILSSLKLNWSLRMVDLSYNGLGNQGANAVCDVLRSNNRLKTLDISGNRFRDEAVKTIAEGISRNVGLHSLSLKDNPIGNEGLMSVMTAIVHNRHSGIRVLDFTGVPISPNILEIVETIRDRIQSEPVKPAFQQQLLQQQELQKKFGLLREDSSIVMRDFEFFHGDVFKPRRPIPVFAVARVRSSRRNRQISSAPIFKTVKSKITAAIAPNTTANNNKGVVGKNNNTKPSTNTSNNNKNRNR